MSFKLAAVKVLASAKEPLHVEEITKRALENGLIETSGATPERTMSTELRRDIKSKQNNSAFRLVGNAIFSLNPSFTQEKLEKEEKEEIKREEEVESERITSQYIGRAGEHLVVSELLFRGYNASIMTVDEGLDITAIKEDKLFNIQAKTSKENKFNKHVITISVSSFESHQSHNTYYIFVLRGNTTNFLILPYLVIRKNIDESNILQTSNKRYKVEINVDKERFLLGRKKEDISYYNNRWNLIK